MQPDQLASLDSPAGRAQTPGESEGPQGEPVVSVRDLRMSYGGLEAVRGIDLELRRGEILALVGPNGAGKTSTVEILEGFRRRTAGQVSVLGEDPEGAGPGWRARIGVVLESSEVERELTVRECLELYAGYYRSPRTVADTISLIGLGEKADTRCGRLSHGQQRRVDVALALIGDPELMFLDEPTTGFDPLARRAAWEVIAGLRELGKTTLLTTHYMEEAETLADRIVVLAGGRVAAEGTPETLGGRDRAPCRVSFSLPAGFALADLPSPLAELASHDGSGVTIVTSTPVEHLHALSGWAMERGLPLADISVQRPTLEDVYLALTDGREAGQ